MVQDGDVMHFRFNA
ncbi:MAG: hypothetical protein K2P95_02085 [Hyphomonadaceae bacterium]|nr:hypothetical protein [Hyphomonadaceae bacterium]